MLSDANNVSKLGGNFYNMGWLTLGLIVIFNGSYLLIFLYDLCLCTKQSNKERIYELRLDYYQNKLRNYESL